MSSISDFVKTKAPEERLRKIRSCSSKEERREMEQHLLVPAELPPYTREEPNSKSDVSDKKVTFVFGDLKDVEMLAKHFKISEYKGKNVRSSNLNLMIDFLNALESEEIIYDKAKRKFRYNSGSSKVGNEERGRKIKRQSRNLR